MFIGQILWVASNKNTLKQISTKTRKKEGRKRGEKGTEGGREGETVKERKKWKRKGEKEIGYRLERKRKGLESTNHGYTL